MSKIRLRDNAQGITRPSLEYAKKNLHRLGGVHTIRGYRFTSKRSYHVNGEKRSFSTDHEAVLLRGPNGTMRLEGILWGYFGEGTRGLSQILQACGLSRENSDRIAFQTRRRNIDGIDFELNFPVALATYPEKIV